MTATISAQDAITAVHEAAQLGGNDGLTFASIQAMTGLVDNHLRLVLEALARRGIMSRIDGRWVAWTVCPTCGFGERDRYYHDYHPTAGACETGPADRHAGYPLTEAA